jgi:hypothetical protein
MKKEFWKKFILSFALFRYKELTKCSTKEAVSYFITLFSIAFAIAMIIAVPAFMSIPKALDRELSKVETFRVDVEFNSTQDLNFPSKNPAIVVANKDNASKAMIVITKEEIRYRPIFGIQTRIPTADFKDVKENRGRIIGLITPLLLFLAPSFIVLAYIFTFAKYLIIAVLLSAIAKGAIVLFKKSVKYKKMFNAGIYSLTPLVLAEMIIVPLNLKVYHMLILLYIVWYMVISFEMIEEF